VRQDVSVADAGVEAVIVPANKASWEDLEAVLGGATCHGGRCYCQRYKLGHNAWPGDALDRAHMLREQTDCGHSRSWTTTGLVAYLDGEPAGWCNVEPRTALGGAVLYHPLGLSSARHQLCACACRR
jgi:hypothetical protein